MGREGGGGILKETFYNIPKKRKNNDTYTTVFSSLDTTSAGVPIWQIIISAVGGLIVLLIILIILVKIGFFRKVIQ